MSKILLTDCDGVLLDWIAKFETFTKRLGYHCSTSHAHLYGIGERLNISREDGDKLVSKFNSSSDFSSLEPFRDSVSVIIRLKSEGWKIIVITTAGLHPWTPGLRRINLDRVFGEDVIDEIHVLDMHGDKGEILKNYKDSGLYWIEDSPSNAELGLKYGLNPLLMNNPYNISYTGTVKRVNTWHDIYGIINGTTI